MSEGLERSAATLTGLVSAVQGAIDAQRKWMDTSLQVAAKWRERQTTQLEALWWAEALYSPSIGRGYREVSPAVAAFLMAKDLCKLMPRPAPASVGYLLAEAVGRIPGAGHGQPVRLTDVLRDLRSARKDLPAEFRPTVESLRGVGRLGLRDVVASAVGDQEFDANSVLARSLVREDPELTFPKIAHALFRQQQAVDLAGGRK
jgi:hypothetical protein